MRESKHSLLGDDRVWYDQFTSTDWVHDSIADAYRVKALRSRKDIRGRIEAFFDGAQGWILSALVGIITAVIAYIVDVSEAPVFDWKDGYCSQGLFVNEKVSCVLSFCCFPIIMISYYHFFGPLQERFHLFVGRRVVPCWIDYGPTSCPPTLEASQG